MADQSDDHEVGASASVGMDGFTAKVKSRFISAIDRLLARKIDAADLGNARGLEVSKALTKSQIMLIEIATKAIADKVAADAGLAVAILQGAVKREAEGIQNKAEVLTHALEDLHQRPTSKDQGEEKLEPEFLSRFELYAEGSSTEALRERWGRVLAEEIRKPGTFSYKVMRVVDEIEPNVARLFEDICSARVGEFIPLHLRALRDNEVVDLVDAGLLVDPNTFGYSLHFRPRTFPDGSGGLSVMLGNYSLVCVTPISINQDAAEDTLSIDLGRDGDSLKLGVNILTRAGTAIAKLVADNQEGAAKMVVEAIQQRLKTPVKLLIRSDDRGYLEVD